MKLTGNKRIRGEFDSVDLIAGLLIALCIPTLTYFVLKNTGVAKKSDPQGYLKKASKTVLASPIPSWWLSSSSISRRSITRPAGSS